MSASRGRARIGLLVPYTNTNFEPDMAMLRPDGVSLHVARMAGYDEDAIPDETQMQGMGAAALDEPLHMLKGACPDVVVYGCTSATLSHGPAFDRALAQRIRDDSGAQTVTAAGALVHALTTLGARRIGFASPYVPAINDFAVSFLSKHGFETVQRSEVSKTLDNTGQGALTPQDVHALGIAADHPDADVLVLSCTDMRSVEALHGIEAHVGKPVISSNQAIVFQALQLLQIGDPVAGFGQLLERPRT